MLRTSPCPPKTRHSAMAHPLHKGFYQQASIFSLFCYVLERKDKVGKGLRYSNIKICYIACFWVSWFSCGLFYMAVRLYHNRKNYIFFQSFNTKNFAFSCYYVIFALVWQSSKRQLESAYTQIFANRASIRCLFITTISPRWTSS